MTGLIGLLIIAFLFGLGYVVGRVTGKSAGRELGIAEEAARWKGKEEWKIKKGERHA